MAVRAHLAAPVGPRADQVALQVGRAPWEEQAAPGVLQEATEETPAVALTAVMSVARAAREAHRGG